MTAASYDAKINSNYRTIEGLNTEIIQLENKLEDLIGLKNQFVNFSGVFEDTVNKAYRSVEGIFGLAGKIHAFVNRSFFAGLSGIIKGGEYSNAKNGIEDSISRIQEEITKTQNQIEEKRYAINQCYSNISSLQSQKAAALRAEEAARAAQAAEAARIAEAALETM